MNAETWLPVIVTAAIQIIVAAYVYGKLSQQVVDADRRMNSLEKWQRDDVEPVLSDHAERIAIVETKIQRTQAKCPIVPHD